MEQRGGGIWGDPGLPAREINNPAPRSIRIFEKVDEEEISRRLVGLERERPRLRRPNTLGFSSGGEHEGRRSEEREGMIGLRSRKLDRSIQTGNLEEKTPKEAPTW